MADTRAERRLAAILVADVVGYSHLIEQDEAGTLAALKDLRREVIDPLLTEYRGRIVKLMGDGAIVEFGSVVDAVACADAIQRGVADRQKGSPVERRLVFRIGINLGDVVVEDGDLLGDGINIAARLEQLCYPGGILVSGTVYDHLQASSTFPWSSPASITSRTSRGWCVPTASGWMVDLRVGVSSLCGCANGPAQWRPLWWP